MLQCLKVAEVFPEYILSQLKKVELNLWKLNDMKNKHYQGGLVEKSGKPHKIYVYVPAFSIVFS
jgi:hypothetical protein